MTINLSILSFNMSKQLKDGMVEEIPSAGSTSPWQILNQHAIQITEIIFTFV